MDENRLTGEKMVKLLIKLSNSENVNRWVHLCYVPALLNDTYNAQRLEDAKNLNVTLVRWAKEDFKKDISLDTLEDLETLKGMIKAFCKEAYPDIYLEQATDRQGWLRVWVTKKMKEDLEINGE